MKACLSIRGILDIPFIRLIQKKPRSFDWGFDLFPDFFRFRASENLPHS
ncbi:Uncharacterised protein [Vibrio vulnificus]|nr:Uncharacterised protein [Vibrio vulnificus]